MDPSHSALRNSHWADFVNKLHPICHFTCTTSQSSIGSSCQQEDLLIVPSSTFLKRKGGLFKKAHELSVLCSVDVAVIIFGHNKKLYEYSSGDINETIDRFHYVSANISVFVWRLTTVIVW